MIAHDWTNRAGSGRQLELVIRGRSARETFPWLSSECREACECHRGSRAEPAWKGAEGGPGSSNKSLNVQYAMPCTSPALHSVKWSESPGPARPVEARRGNAHLRASTASLELPQRARGHAQRPGSSGQRQKGRDRRRGEPDTRAPISQRQIHQRSCGCGSFRGRCGSSGSAVGRFTPVVRGPGLVVP
jgi:hypothetical protein